MATTFLVGSMDEFAEIGMVAIRIGLVPVHAAC
jgi:hypothetical protein